MMEQKTPAGGRPAGALGGFKAITSKPSYSLSDPDSQARFRARAGRIHEQAASQVLACAKKYARLGLPVLPLKARSKVPATPRGYRDASTDPALIERWFTDPDANIGIVVGGPAWVLDIDVKHDGLATLAWLELDNGLLPETWTCETGGGGLHIYFAPPAPPKRRIGAFRGIDVLASGGFVVAPPSVHPVSRKCYAWKRDLAPWEVPLAPAPGWLLTALSPPVPVPILVTVPEPNIRHSSRYAAAAFRGAVDDVAGAPEWQRQNALNRGAFRLGKLSRQHSIAASDATVALAAAATRNGLAADDGLDACVRTIARAFEAGRAAP